MEPDTSLKLAKGSVEKDHKRENLLLTPPIDRGLLSARISQHLGRENSIYIPNTFQFSERRTCSSNNSKTFRSGDFQRTIEEGA
jgi:hypothetical protein